MSTAEGQAELAQAKKDQQELIDAQDVMISYIDGGVEAYAQTFKGENTENANDKAYVKNAISEGAEAEAEMYAQTPEGKFEAQQA